MDCVKLCKINADGGDGGHHVRRDCKLTETQELQLKENYPEVLHLIRCLQKLIEKQYVKIHRLKSKLKRQTSNDVASQTDSVTIIKDEEESTTRKSAPTDLPKNLSEEIKEVAEMAMHKTGFVYEETSGLYYDYNSGYYYNAELGLYYDGNTGTYMTYNTETQSYDFHSQVNVANTKREDNYTRSKRKKKDRGTLKVINSPDVENLMQSFNQLQIKKPLRHVALDVARGWPPCMRIIVKSSDVVKVKAGTLYIVTCDGGTLGREGDDHVIVIPDINISKHHLRFAYDKEANQYAVIDLGSRNGTLLNGKRISSSKQESEPMEVVHGSQVQVGSTLLLCHIHYGNETCGHCEPGLLQTNVLTDNPKEVSLKFDKTQQHKDELRKLRKKFGVAWSNPSSGQLAEGYTDRAQARRQTVGSHNEHEKTQVASVDQSIGSENKGFKLLSKMGWSEGQSLGKKGSTGLLDPVELVSAVGTTGIGYTGYSPNTSLLKKPPKKETVWEKTQKRYQNISEIGDSD